MDHITTPNIRRFIFPALLLITACQHRPVLREVNTQYQLLRSVEEIQPITKPLVKPVLYTNVLSLEGVPVARQKQKFIDLMLPAILVAKFNLEQKRVRIHYLHEQRRQQKTWSHEDSTFVSAELDRYDASDIRYLERKIKPHPVSLVLAQAALESGWGTSTFFVEANNVFGVWSYREDEPRIESSARRGERTVFLRKYENLSLSVEDYYETLGRVSAYRTFRKKRFENENPYVMLPQLNKYSELGRTYTRRLRSVIKDNRLTRYDTYQIDPEYIRTQSTGLTALKNE
jgi:Bax protein